MRQHAVAGAQLPHAGEVVVGRHDCAGLTLDRLHHEAGDLHAYRFRASQLLVERIGVAVGNEVHVLEPLLERLPERRLPHEGERTQRLAVESGERGDEGVGFRVESRELDRTLDRVRAIIDEERVLQLTRRDFGEHPR